MEMESWNSPDDEILSPSQETITYGQSLRRDGESLEDFEDITKDDSSMIDITKQFLQQETGDRNKHQLDNIVYQPDKEFHFDQKSKDHQQKSNDEITNQTFDEFENPHSSASLEPSGHTDREDSVNDLISIEQIDTQNRFGINGLTSKQLIVSILNENTLTEVGSNDEISTGSDDLSYTPKKGESSPILHSESEKDTPKKLPSECRAGEADSPCNTQPLSRFTSEPGVNREQEPEKLHGDGLHVKQTIEGDMSENDDDFIPEPIPKDYPVMCTIKGKPLLASIGLDTWFRPDLLHPKVESLIYWRDPKKSGIVFGAGLIILLSLTSFSLISVVAYTSLTVLVSALAFRIYKSVMQAVQKTSDGHPFKNYLVAVLNHPIITTVFNTIEEYLDIDLTVNPDKAREISDVVISHVNGALTEFRRLFLIEDILESIKFALILWGFTYVGAWFNGLSLLIIGFVGLFTLPKVYENNKTQIDANINLVRTKINEITEKITAVIPMAKKSEEAKEKGE